MNQPTWPPRKLGDGCAVVLRLRFEPQQDDSLHLQSERDGYFGLYVVPCSPEVAADARASAVGRAYEVIVSPAPEPAPASEAGGWQVPACCPRARASAELLWALRPVPGRPARVFARAADFTGPGRFEPAVACPFCAADFRLPDLPLARRRSRGYHADEDRVALFALLAAELLRDELDAAGGGDCPACGSAGTCEADCFLRRARDLLERFPQV